MSNRFHEALVVLMNPRCWTTVFPFSQDADDLLRDLLNDPNLKIEPAVYQYMQIESIHTVLLNGQELWKVNRPYSCGMHTNKLDGRPSRYAMVKFHKLMNEYEKNRTGHI